MAGALSHSGIACWHLGRYPEANDSPARTRSSLYREVGDRRGEAKTLNNLGRIHLYCGYHRDALDAYEQSLEIFREIGGAQNEAILYHNIGSVHHYKGSYEEGLAACRRALAIYRSIGDLPDEADVLNDIGAIYQSAACYDEALVHHQKARLIAEEIGNLSQQLIALRMIADIHRGSGRYGEAFDALPHRAAAGPGDRRPVRGRQDPRGDRRIARSARSGPTRRGSCSGRRWTSSSGWACPRPSRRGSASRPSTRPPACAFPSPANSRRSTRPGRVTWGARQASRRLQSRRPGW